MSLVVCGRGHHSTTWHSAPARALALHSPCALAEKQQQRRRRKHDEDGADDTGDDAPDSKQVVARHGGGGAAAAEEFQTVEVESRSILQRDAGVRDVGDDGADDDVSVEMKKDYDDYSQPASVRAEWVLVGDDDVYYEDDWPPHFARAWLVPSTPW